MQDIWLDLEAAALREVASTWSDFNWGYFREALIPPSFGTSAAANELGKWDLRTRTITLSRALLFEQRWGAVEEVLKHEMAHQFADEVLEATDEPAHGPAFRAACDRIGIDPRASGPLSEDGIAQEDERVIRKVARLLSLATSPNQHEAEAATVAARRLMLEHNIDAQSAPRRYSYKRLGRPVRRLDEGLRVLGRILGEHFFVEVLWVREYLPLDRVHGTVMEIMGTAPNLAIAEYVFDYLQHTATELWTQHQATSRRGRGDKRTFQSGVMHGFLEKLREQHKTSSQERALVWVKDAELDAYFRRRHPRVQTVRRQGRRRDATFQEGKSAGRKIVLRKGVETSTSSRGRLLGPGRSS